MSDLPWQNLRDVVAELKLDESPDDRIAVRRAILRRLKELHTDTTSALSESTSPELKKLTAALQFVREFQRNPTDALALTQVTALAKKTDDSLALIAEALKSVARGTERSVDERAASRLVESRRSISHQLRPPKISLAAISATLAAVYAFPDQVLSSRVLSEYIPIALVIRFWPVGIIGLASLWVIVWWREAGLRNTAERVLGSTSRGEPWRPCLAEATPRCIDRCLVLMDSLEVGFVVNWRLRPLTGLCEMTRPGSGGRLVLCRLWSI